MLRMCLHLNLDLRKYCILHLWSFVRFYRIANTFFSLKSNFVL